MVYGFITVRTASSRLKEKCLLAFGEGNVLQHVIRRARFYDFNPVICTTDASEDNIIEQIARQEDCLVYRGSVEDKLQRWLDAADEFGIEAFHTIDADDPFFDGELGHRSFNLLRQGHDVIYPSKTTFIGSVGYSLTRDVVNRACSLKDSDKTEMMWYFIELVPGLRKMELPVTDTRISRIRLTLDYEEDYWLLTSVLRLLGHNATRVEIEDLFIRNPDLYQINWFRNEEWKKGQEQQKQFSEPARLKRYSS